MPKVKCEICGKWLIGIEIKKLNSPWRNFLS